MNTPPVPHRLRATRVLFLGLAVLLAVETVRAQEAATQAPPRKPAPVMTFHGAEWLERPEREKEEKPGEVIKAMGLKDGDIVVDMGTGTGYFARRMARAVAPKGKVYAVDIQPEMLAILEKLCKEEGVTNVVPVLGEEEDPKLPKGEADWMLLVDVYHEFQKPQPMLAKIRDALKPDGKVCLVEYRAEDNTAAHIKREHRMDVDQVVAEWSEGGFELVDRLETLPSQHLFIFKKREKL